MTHHIKSTLLISTLAIGLSSLFSGCATTGSERADMTTTKMESVDAELRQAIVQLDATGVSLENLMRPGQPDLKTSFQSYSENVDKMARIGEKLIKHTDEMSARGKDYFDEWKKQGNAYTNPQIREISEKRSAELNNIFRNISESSIGVKGASMAYMNDIKEIRAFLSTDLTAKGVESITPIAQKAIRDGANLKNSVMPVLSALDGARTEMAQGGSN